MILTIIYKYSFLIQPPPMVFWTSSKLCECWRLAVSWLFKFGYCGPLGTKILMIPQSWRPQVTFKEGQFTQKMVKKRYLPPLPPPTAWETGGLQCISLVSIRGSYIPNFTALGQILTAPEQFKALSGVSYPQDPVQLYSGPGQKFLMIWITIHKRSLQTKFHYSKLKIECSRVVFKFINILILAGFCLQVYS